MVTKKSNQSAPIRPTSKKIVATFLQGTIGGMLPMCSFRGSTVIN